MKESLKAKRLQTKLAINILTGTIPKEARAAYWTWPIKVWHLEGPIEEKKTPHCNTCRCYQGMDHQMASLCRTAKWSMGFNTNNQSVPKNARPCKRCLQALDKIAKSGV